MLARSHDAKDGIPVPVSTTSLAESGQLAGLQGPFDLSGALAVPDKQRWTSSAQQPGRRLHERGLRATAPG
jgi:hypothetical protein